MTFAEALEKAGTGKPAMVKILGVEYARDGDPKQDTANFMAAALPKCEELLGFDKLAEVMFHRACCKSGFRLKNAEKLNREHGGKPLDEKLELLGRLKYMGCPRLNADGDIETVGVGRMDRCPCWQLGGNAPAGGSMPLSYCLCCAGHFRFHYEKALGLKLRVKRVVSSILHSGGKEPCVFVYEIVKQAKEGEAK
jgi:hypothetical protein